VVEGRLGYSLGNLKQTYSHIHLLTVPAVKREYSPYTPDRIVRAFSFTNGSKYGRPMIGRIGLVGVHLHFLPEALVHIGCLLERYFATWITNSIINYLLQLFHRPQKLHLFLTRTS